MNNFKDYGFEADFEGEILKTLNNGDDKIEVLIGYIICNNQIIATTWDISGYCYFSNKFSLKPIKKEWYENPENIGKILKAENTSTKLNELCVFLRLNKDKTITVLGLDGNKFIGFINDFRLATEEEVLSLLVKE